MGVVGMPRRRVIGRREELRGMVVGPNGILEGPRGTEEAERPPRREEESKRVMVCGMCG
jgi:hypothetical protein